MGQRRQLTGLRVLITGASQGIGRALVLHAAQRGMKVTAAARSKEMLETLAREVEAAGGEIEVVVADVTSQEDRKKMLQAAVDRFGGLDVLLNNAGIGATGHFTEADEARLRQIFEVNFFGPAELMRLAIPILEKGNKPMIVNISSAVGKRAFPARSEYSASKYALQGLSDALRAEMVRYGIDLLVVSPGLTSTNFPKNMIENKAKFPMDHNRSMTPEQVADATLRAMEKGKNDIVLTFKAKLMVLINRFFPKLVDRIMRKKVRKLYADEIAVRQQRLAAAQNSEPQQQKVGTA
jgi:short-subunit dehydrogenase